MNEVITKLYDIEEQAGTILKNAQLHKEQLQQQMQEDKKSLEKELEAGLQNRLADVRKQMDEKAREQIEDIKVQYARQSGSIIVKSGRLFFSNSSVKSNLRQGTLALDGGTFGAESKGGVAYFKSAEFRSGR